jgi:hypothetical protein
MEINRVVESWDGRRCVWQPEIRLCHLHAIEYLTGEPVYLPSVAQQKIDMLELACDPDSGPRVRVVPVADAPSVLLFKSEVPFFDLIKALPLDGVKWWICVERTAPKIFAGHQCSGMVRSINQPITRSHWTRIYGGGTYSATVYGPSDRNPNPARLTEPITVTFPGVPSWECCTYDL